MSIEMTEKDARQGANKKNMPLVLGVSTASAAAAMLAIFGIALL
ncbi:MAG: hypothetical protein ACX94B_16075 [Henriciella sp.]|nr:hypothetical protein [Hyphomonadaceae bacterium]